MEGWAVQELKRRLLSLQRLSPLGLDGFGPFSRKLRL